MMKFLLPIVMLVLGLGGGVGAGLFFPAATSEEMVENGETDAAESSDTSAASDEGTALPESENRAVEFLNMTNQFVIPLLADGDVKSIVVLTISLEVVEGTIANVNTLQPKIRDRFLQVLFNFGNNGGFDGNFTEYRHVTSLKEELLRNAQVVAGRDVTNVLILDFIRQDP